MENVRERIIEFKNGFADDNYIELIKMFTRMNRNTTPFKACEIINRYRIGTITEDEILKEIFITDLV